MSFQFIGVPDGVDPTIRQCVSNLLKTSDNFDEHTPNSLQIGAGHYVYNLMVLDIARDIDLSKLEPAGYRFLIRREKEVIAAAEIRQDDKGFFVASVTQGFVVSETARALSEAERWLFTTWKVNGDWKQNLPSGKLYFIIEQGMQEEKSLSSRTSDTHGIYHYMNAFNYASRPYERLFIPGLLQCSALSINALLLRTHAHTQGIIWPLTPEQGNTKETGPYSEENFLKAIRPLAKRFVAAHKESIKRQISRQHQK